jgi:hypothetical protein
VEILSSMIIINRRYPENIFIKNFLEKNNKNFYKDFMEDEYCDFYFKEFITPCIEVFNDLKNKEYSNNVMFIEYKNLIKDTKNVLDYIYNFLNVNQYSNDLKNIKKVEDFSDVYFKANMHEIRPEISLTNNNPKEILSVDIYNKYKDINL